jgi:hypothetical protein
LLVKYARLPRSLTRAEWPQALKAFDLLHSGQVTLDGDTLSFQSFYLRSIDATYATSFLEQLLETTDVEAEGERLTEELWRQIDLTLTQQGLGVDTAEGRALIAYCVYWWRSFCKGYAREVAVFRDLEQSGIDYDAHDLREPAQRRSAHDLTVLRQRGDVKTSTYFLHTARSFPLRSDFYVVRLWNAEANQWLDLVLLKPEAWRELDGEPIPCEWESIAGDLPGAAQVKVRGETLVVVLYADWKARVRNKQSMEGGSMP